MRRQLALILVPLVVAMSGCGDDDDDTATADGTSTSTSTDPAPLLGHTYLSQSATQDGQPKPLVEGTRVELSFPDDGRLVASAGCNTLGGEVVVGPTQLTVADLSMTEMGCDPERHDQDEWLAALLIANPTYELDGTRLTLRAGGGELVLEDREVADPDRPLEGTTWQLDGLISGDFPDAAASSVPAGAGATLVFEGGRVSVTIQDCNQGSAEVEIGDGSMTVGPLGMTKMACQPPASEVEAAVVAVLEGEVAYSVSAGALTVQKVGGPGLTLRG